MAVYQREGINPLADFSVLVQMPICLD